MGSVGKKATPKLPVVDYRMSVHYGVCQGPVDTLNEIWIDQLSAWTGRAGAERTIIINKPDLFGGPKKTGGAVGLLHWNDGSYTQKSSEALAVSQGKTVDTMPGYRGIANGFFTGGGEDGTTLSIEELVDGAIADAGELAAAPTGNGFKWSTNQPATHPVWFNVTRVPRAWYPCKAAIPRGGSGLGDRAVFFLLDKSLSLEPEEFTQIKEATKAQLDELQIQVELGYKVDVAVCFWSAANAEDYLPKLNASPADFDELRTFVDNAVLLTGGDIVSAVDRIPGFFATVEDTDYSSRVVCFVTDSLTPDNMALAASNVSDLLDPTGGVYNEEDGTAVYWYGIAINSTTYDNIGNLDNTSSDAVPTVIGGDTDGLICAMSLALAAGGELDANPAHMIYECLTDDTWGMGASSSAIDLVSFQEAADTFYREGFGLSMLWTQSTEIQKFIQEILDHVEATLYVSPDTGQFRLKTIRDDYDEGALPLYTDTLCYTTSFHRRAPAETINEVNLTWTNPINEQEEVITAQDLGGIVVNNGQIISDNRNYYGVRSLPLAKFVLERDLGTATAPLSTAEVLVNRTGWDLVPGDVIKYQSADHNGGEELIMRVMKVNYGRPGASQIAISLSEDVFAFTRPTLALPPSTEAAPDGFKPEAFEHVLFMTLNYYLSGYYSGVADADYPDVLVGVMADTTNVDVENVEMIGESVDIVGNSYLSEQATLTYTTRGELAVAMEQEATTEVLAFDNLSVGKGPTLASFGYIGPDDAPEEDMELVLFASHDGTNWHVVRGVLDTTPKDWPIGTPIRFLRQSKKISEGRSRMALDTLDYKVRMRTSLGVQAADKTALLNFTTSERPYQPTRPAFVTVNSVGFGSVDCQGLGNIPIEWANRNKLTEDSQVLEWENATITPEAGQTTSIVVINPADDSIVNRVDGLTGTTYSMPVGEFGGLGVAIVKVISVLDGFDSFQGHEIVAELDTGYGLNYGLNYGAP